MTEKELKWRKALKNMCITGVSLVIVGIGIMSVGLFLKDYAAFLYPFGGAFIFLGVLLAIMTTVWLTRKDSYKNAMAENDERNQQLYAKAGALAWQLVVSVATLVAGVLMCFDVDVIPTRSILLILISGLFLHRVIFFIMKKKY